MADKTEPVRRMIEAWDKRDIDLMMDQFADGAIFDNVPMDRIQGKEAIRAANAAFMDMIEAAPWKVRNIFEAPNGTVLTERDDIFILKDGRTVNCPVMGAFEINEDNKITHWRDYFDLGDWNRQLGMDPDLGRRSNPAP